jgi:hypothetical protein
LTRARSCTTGSQKRRRRPSVGRIRSADKLDETDFRRNSPRFAGDNFQANWRIVEVVGRRLGRERASRIGALKLHRLRWPCPAVTPGENDAADRGCEARRAAYRQADVVSTWLVTPTTAKSFGPMIHPAIELDPDHR